MMREANPAIDRLIPGDCYDGGHVGSFECEKCGRRIRQGTRIGD